MNGEVLVGALAFLISLAAFAMSVRVTQSDASLQVTNSLNELLRAALTCDNLINTLYAVFPRYDPNDSIETKRQRVVTHHVLNIIEYAYLVSDRSVMDDIEAHKIVTKLLSEVLSTQIGKDALEKGKYDPRFIEWAKPYQS
jgi:hypothetical protein